MRRVDRSDWSDGLETRAGILGVSEDAVVIILACAGTVSVQRRVPQAPVRVAVQT